MVSYEMPLCKPKMRKLFISNSLVGVTVSEIVNEPDPSEARSMLAGIKVGQESHEDHRQTSQQTDI